MSLKHTKLMILIVATGHSVVACSAAQPASQTEIAPRDEAHSAVRISQAQPADGCSQDDDCPDDSTCHRWCPVSGEVGFCVEPVGAGYCAPKQRRTLTANEFMVVMPGERPYGVLRRTPHDPLGGDETMPAYDVVSANGVHVAMAPLDAGVVTAEERALLGQQFQLFGARGLVCTVTAHRFASIARLQATRYADADSEEELEPVEMSDFHLWADVHAAFHIVVEFEPDEGNCDEAIWARSTGLSPVYFEPTREAPPEIADALRKEWSEAALRRTISDTIASEGGVGEWFESKGPGPRGLRLGPTGQIEHRDVSTRVFKGPDGEQYGISAAWTGQAWCTFPAASLWGAWRIVGKNHFTQVGIGMEAVWPSFVIDIDGDHSLEFIEHDPLQAHLVGVHVESPSSIVTAGPYSSC